MRRIAECIHRTTGKPSTQKVEEPTRKQRSIREDGFTTTLVEPQATRLPAKPARNERGRTKVCAVLLKRHASHETAVPLF